MTVSHEQIPAPSEIGRLADSYLSRTDKSEKSAIEGAITGILVSLRQLDLDDAQHRRLLFDSMAPLLDRNPLGPSLSTNAIRTLTVSQEPAFLEEFLAEHGALAEKAVAVA